MPDDTAARRDLPRRVLHYVDVVWNQGQTSRVREFLAPDFRQRNLRDEVLRNSPEEVAADVDCWRAALGDCSLRVLDLVCEGDQVAWRWELRGELASLQALSGPLRELAALVPALATVSLTGMTFSRFRSGLIVEQDTEADYTGLLDQLGTSA